jgi:hypothetical protein
MTNVKLNLTTFLRIALLALPSVKIAAQTSDHFLDVTFSPSLGFRVLGDYKVPSTWTKSRVQFRDSLYKADRPGQSMNFGIQYMTKKNSFSAFSLGLSYTSLVFRRVRENLQISDLVHPDVGYVTGVIQAANLRVKYDYRYRYVEASMLWYQSAEGYKNLKDLDLWYFIGFSPAILVRDRVHIFTEGFTMPNGKDVFNVKDKDIRGVVANCFGQAGMRIDYNMYRRIHALIQPRFRLPLLPSSQGMQTIWIPQASLDLGLIFYLDEEIKKR